MTFRSIAAVFCILFAGFSYFLTVSAQGVIVPIICDFRPPYLSLGEQVVIGWKGKIYRITK